LKKDCGFEVIDMKATEEIVKNKLSTEDDPVEEVPYIEVEKEIVSTIKSN
jgi:hypothetical protein